MTSRSSITSWARLVVACLLAVTAALFFMEKPAEATWAGLPVLTVDVSPAEGGTIKLNGAVVPTYPNTTNFTSDESVKLEAVAASGYRFVGWTGSLSGTLNPQDLVMSCARNVTAVFMSDKPGLNIQVSGSGKVTPAVGFHPYEIGTVVNISATPDVNNQFDGWSGDVADPHAASTTVTIKAATLVIANFTRKTHTIHLEASEGGSTIPSPRDYGCSEGSNFSLSAIPDNGYQFDGWTGDVVNPTLANTTTVIVTSDITVKANFSRIGGVVITTAATPTNTNLPTPTDSNNNDKESSLPPGGIIVGCIVIAAVIAGGGIWMVRRRRTRT